MHVFSHIRAGRGYASVRSVLCVALFLASVTTVFAQVPNIGIGMGSQLEPDSIAYISWTQLDIDGPIRVEYSTDSMLTWKFVDTVSTEGTSGMYLWRVPDEPTTNGFIRMIYRDTVRGRSGRFSITNDPIPHIQVYRPGSNESFFPGTPLTILWFGQFMRARPIVIEFSSDSGATWQQIGFGPSSRDGIDSLPWIIPNVQTFGARIRVRSADSVHLFMSGIFTIRAPKTVSLHYPRGGEVFAIDSTVMIQWTTRSITSGVSVEYSIDGGDFWFNVAARSGHEGPDSVAWIVPPPLSDSVYVRVVAEDGAIVDSTDRPLRIVAVLTSAPDEATAPQRAMRLVAAPNPATSAVTLAWEQPQATSLLLRVHAADGSLVRDESLGARSMGAQTATIDLGDLAAGAYVLTLSGDDASSSTLVVVRK